MPSPYDWPHSSWPRDPHQRARIPDSELRVSNAERDAVSNALCRHFSDGRLDEAEFNERLEKCTAAKTRADLAPLLADLPPLPGDGPQPHPQPVPAARPWRIHPVVFVLGVLFVLVATAHFTAWAWHAPWLLIAVIVVVALVRRRRHYC